MRHDSQANVLQRRESKVSKEIGGIGKKSCESKGGIGTEASKERRKWESHEISILMQHASAGIDVLVILLQRTSSSIFHKASRLKIEVPEPTGYNLNGGELENKSWIWSNRILPSLIPTNSECLEWRGSNSRGYGQVRFFFCGKNRIVSTHRLAWEVENGIVLPSSVMVLHRCDNRRCNNHSHLFIGSAKDNTQDMMAKGRGRGQFKALITSVESARTHLDQLKR